MNWYLAKIVYQIECGSDYLLAQFDDQLRLIMATDEEQALQKAYSIGESEQMTLVNNNEQLVSWRFINVAELYCVSHHLDGAEVYSSVHEVSNADAYIKLVNDKNARIMEGATRKHLNLI